LDHDTVRVAFRLFGSSSSEMVPQRACKICHTMASLPYRIAPDPGRNISAYDVDLMKSKQQHCISKA
jgi:hypothetical protein